MNQRDELRLVSLCGLLGYGYPPDSLERALEARPHLIGVDAGSTDPGPYYLGAGESFVSDAQVERDLEPALRAAVEKRIPLVVGTAGGSGARPHLEHFLKIVRRTASRRGLHFRMAVIPAEVPKETVLDALDSGRIVPCRHTEPLSREDVEACAHVVGQMGTEPIVEALDAGADVVVAGRCCDTAVFAAEPIRRGFDPGLALHLGKIMECGALCARPAGANDALIGTMREDSFETLPANPARRCTPESVAAHSLYEQPDPNAFHEPEGKVDLSECTFEPAGDRAVCVRGSRLSAPDRQTVKLEGARLRGYRTVTIAGIRDPGLLERLDSILDAVRETVSRSVADVLAPDAFSLRFLRYGLDGVMGALEESTSPPREVGLVIEAVAPSQELADRVLKLARSTALHQHCEGRKTTAGNLAFPFSPSDLRGGAVYEFAIYHLLQDPDMASLFPVQWEQV